MSSMATRESNSPSGRHLEPRPSSEPQALASNAAAAASKIEVCSSSGDLAFNCSHVASLPGAHGSARRMRAATATTAGRRHAEDARLNVGSSVAS